MGCPVDLLSDTSTLVYKDHLSTETTVGCPVDLLSDTSTLVYKDHLYTETTVGCPVGLLSDTSTLVYKDHLYTEDTAAWSLGGPLSTGFTISTNITPTFQEELKTHRTPVYREHCCLVLEWAGFTVCTKHQQHSRKRQTLRGTSESRLTD